MDNPNYREGEQCPYLNNGCQQDKLGICILDYEKCTIYQKIYVLDPDKELGIGAMDSELIKKIQEFGMGEY